MDKFMKFSAVLLTLAWLCSLVLPVAIMGPLPSNVYPGWGILLIGWLGVFVFQFGWIANIAFILTVALLILPIYRLRFIYFFAAVPLLITTSDALLWHEIYGDSGTANIPQFGAGYYVWFFAMYAGALLLLARAVFGQKAILPSAPAP